MSCDPVTWSGHSQTASVPAWWQIPPEGCVVAAAGAAGCEADDGTACDAGPGPEVCCGPQPATMIAAASNAARPPLAAIEPVWKGHWLVGLSFRVLAARRVIWMMAAQWTTAAWWAGRRS